MRKFLSYVFGVVVGLFLFPLLCDMIDIVHYYKETEFTKKLYYFTLNPTYEVGPIFTGGCTKDVSKNGHGWVFVRREYYNCGKIAIFISDKIFGEYEHTIDPELAKKLKHNYRF